MRRLVEAHFPKIIVRRAQSSRSATSFDRHCPGRAEGLHRRSMRPSRSAIPCLRFAMRTRQVLAARTLCRCPKGSTLAVQSDLWVSAEAGTARRPAFGRTKACSDEIAPTHSTPDSMVLIFMVGSLGSRSRRATPSTAQDLRLESARAGRHIRDGALISADMRFVG